MRAVVSIFEGPEKELRGGLGMRQAGGLTYVRGGALPMDYRVCRVWGGFSGVHKTQKS